MKAYSAIAKSYEYLQNDYDYEKWSQFVCDSVKDAPSKNGVDVGAGTGLITISLFKAGYKVCGTDISDEMLNVAYEKSNGQIAFYKQSAEKFSGFRDLGFVTAVNDVVNYLSPKKMIDFFGRVYKSLLPKGKFVFDISSEYKLKKVLGNEVFTCEEEDVSYIWSNDLKKDRVNMFLTVFTKTEDGKYERGEEFHTQYIHSKDFILSELKKLGFIVKVTAEYGKKLSPKSLRLIFTCEKN